MIVLKLVNKSYCLQEICESNYAKLFGLIPNLLTIREQAVARLRGKPALRVKITDRTRYTITLELTHCFQDELRTVFEPVIKVRLYLDAQAAEVVQHQGPSPKAHDSFLKAREFMERKWSHNYFLDKWLSYCLQLGYDFNNGSIDLVS